MLSPDAGWGGVDPLLTCFKSGKNWTVLIVRRGCQKAAARKCLLSLPNTRCICETYCVLDNCNDKVAASKPTVAAYGVVLCDKSMREKWRMEDKHVSTGKGDMFLLIISFKRWTFCYLTTNIRDNNHVLRLNFIILLCHSSLSSLFCYLAYFSLIYYN